MKSYVLPEGINCIVIFDIPEDVRHIRKQLGTFLESASFIRIQRSVWISNVDAGDLLIKLFRAAGLERGWVRIYNATELDV